MTQVERSWASYVTSAIYTPRVWMRHRRELLDLIRYTREKQIRLMVVLFPFLADVEWRGSRGVISAVEGVFDEEGVPSLNLYEQFSGRDPRELVVNDLDAHPNEATHREVAELLLEAIRREGW